MSRKHWKKINRLFIKLCIFICIIFCGALCGFTILYNSYNLDLSKLTAKNNGIYVYAKDKKSETLYNSNRGIIEIDKLPNYVINAFVDVEDKRFFEHNGYDLKRIVKSTIVNLQTKSKSQGASTISQQLIKNSLLSNEKTYTRKLKEVILSMKMEKKFSKMEILEMYLNTIYFGSNAYGIENASQIYFGKSASDLTIAESCTLAGIIRSPKLYSPIINKENAKKRRNLVAKIMLNANHLSNEEYQEVLNTEITTKKQENSNQDYIREAILEACSLLSISERELINSQYSIETYEDINAQKLVNTSNFNTIKQYEDDLNTNVDSVSMLMDNAGHIIAYIENSDYDLHNMKRQLASTIKPFAVYLPCIKHNMLTSKTHILDEEIDYSNFKPKNADGKFHGYVTAEYALSHSLNIPSVKLLDSIGLKEAKKTLDDFGLNVSRDDMNLTLALGATKNGETLRNLCHAYSILSNQGIDKGATFVKAIYDKSGNTVYKNEDYSETVESADNCFLLTDMLKETAKTGTARRLNDLNLPIAAKTGTASTTNGCTDVYSIAYTTEHTLLTWAGNISNTYLNSTIKSSTLPTDVNKTVLEKLYANSPDDFIVPESIVKLPYDRSILENEHIIVSPTREHERYNDYAYFKSSLPPQKYVNDNLNLSVEVDKSGATITFSPLINAKLIKITDKDYILIENTNEKVIGEYIDNDIFRFDEITYYIETNAGITGEKVKIRPKDYLATLLEKEILSNKRKWYV